MVPSTNESQVRICPLKYSLREKYYLMTLRHERINEQHVYDEWWWMNECFRSFFISQIISSTHRSQVMYVFISVEVQFERKVRTYDFKAWTDKGTTPLWWMKVSDHFFVLYLQMGVVNLWRLMDHRVLRCLPPANTVCHTHWKFSEWKTFHSENFQIVFFGVNRKSNCLKCHLVHSNTVCVWLLRCNNTIMPKIQVNYKRTVHVIWEGAHFSDLQIDVANLRLDFDGSSCSFDA